MLSKENRLKKDKEFNYIYKKGRYINSSNFTIYYVDTYLKNSKVGISVSKKIGNSVVRSRTKRVMTEIVRLNINKLVKNNYVIVLKPSFVDKSFFELQEEFLFALSKANLLKREADV